MSKFKDYIQTFVNSKKDAPIMAALMSGLLPLFFYYSNNYWAANSLSNLLYFTGVLIAVPLVVFFLLYLSFKKLGLLKRFTPLLIFVLMLIMLLVFLSKTYFLSLNKRIILLILTLVLLFFSYENLRKRYKQLIVVLGIFSSLSFVKILVHFYEDLKPDYWLEQSDEISNIKFKNRPNIYMIQPDGYVAQNTLESELYGYKSDLYDWLEQNKFKVYDDFRSNYPASLTSNASLFGMKQHKFGDMLLPEIEMANAREVITYNNPVASIFKNNDYITYFIAQDEYFQQNRKQQSFNYYNIQLEDFPFYSKGGEQVRDVFSDLKDAMSSQNEKPRFFFIEKLLPHHVAFHKTDDSVYEERNRYNERITEVNSWLKETINYITEKDADSIIIVLADHGGWVGLKSFNHLFSTTEQRLINSTFSNLAAIKWNGYLKNNFDKDLKSNVNVFRVLFSVLSDDAKYLQYLEDDSSYNLQLSTLGFKKVKKVINSNGDILD